MPITTGIYNVIYKNDNIREAITDMMQSEFKAENEWE